MWYLQLGNQTDYNLRSTSPEWIRSERYDYCENTNQPLGLFKKILSFFK